MPAFNFKQFLFLLFPVAVLFGCNPRETKTLPKEEKVEPKGEKVEQDRLSTTVYVGEMYFFQETREFYTSVYFDPDQDQRDPELFIPLLDSTIYEGKNFRRKRLPMELARNTFMLSDLDSLFVYDTDHRFITTAMLLRIEYLQDGVDDKFIAVYKGDQLKNDPAEQYYCMNKILPDLQVHDFSYKIINDQSLNGFIVHRLKVKPDHWKIENIEVLPSRAMYSVVTSSEESFITELKDNQFSVLKNMNGKYRIDHILPLPFEVNGKPLLLTYLFIPGIAPRYTSLTVFTDIEEYRILNNNRMRVK